MSDRTKIQWCDSTINPVMGCQGCPLWPTSAALISALAGELKNQGISWRQARELAVSAVDGLPASAVYHGRHFIAGELGGATGRGGSKDTGAIAAAIEAGFRCYAGLLHLHKGKDPTQPTKRTNKGYAPTFEQVTCFPGRMAKMARKCDLTGKPRAATTRRTNAGQENVVPGKPWLDGLPRLVFVSDMGDALSAAVPFDYLESEIVGVVRTPPGDRHIWLWLTKRPARMAEFARWLDSEQGAAWPNNLVAMASVIDGRMARAVDHLRRVPAAMRALSVEPLIEPVKIDLRGIDWVIVGGESGTSARPFDLAWARQLRDQCRARGVAFFCKQLGRRPVEDGLELRLRDKHGGDWGEWPEDLRVREMPRALARVTR
ncbi:MAG TPA: DUF5131 family protein [Verrucomicrobiae bacterium]|nr:DUF5131 family protein [Verrucomicrobiae bacterium]